MTDRLCGLRALTRRVLRDRGGLALIEFAYVTPVFLLFSLTGIELTNFVITRMRISQIALHLADNSSRVGEGTMLEAKKIREKDINDILTGAGLSAGEMELYKKGRVIISSLEPVASPNPTKKYKIGWQRCRGDLTSHASSYGEAGKSSGTNMNGMGPAGHQVTAPDDGGTMFVEVYYEYKPIIATAYVPKPITEVASMMIRDRRDMTKVYNDEKVSKATC